MEQSEELPTVFAPLDCPGAFAVGFGVDALLLGTFVAEVRSPVPVGRELVVIGERAHHIKADKCGAHKESRRA